VIDCDMRRPSCHKATGIQNKLGFVQCLASQISLADAIHPVAGVPNLSLIPCGPIPPNPAEMLSSPIAAELLRELRSQFEYVLLDSPPILSVADSRILSTLTDAVILVARAHHTPYDVVRRARSLLIASGARILGAALNGVNFHKDGYSYHSYYYRQGYGYGADGYGYGYSSSEDAEIDSNSSSHAIEKD
jgi:capsular exopolysaccharide synthesis family protein